jgi:hypothetical protein
MAGEKEVGEDLAAATEEGMGKEAGKVVEEEGMGQPKYF